MKKALKINLGGQIFHIDEDAYDSLKKYLDTISSHFSNIEEGKEVVSDIEFRIAEIFSEKAFNESKIITIEEVNKTIDIMGRPEEIIDEEENGKSTSYSSNTSSSRNRRLYRDPDNAVFGGVAAGLGAYFNIDVVALRILLVVLILAGAGFPFVLYLILWIAVPKATTAAEKLEMKGETINISNLEKKIREEYEEVKTNLNKARNSKTGKRTESFFEEFFRILGRIIIVFLKIIVAFIALILIIVGFSLVAGIIGFGFFNSHIIFPFDMPYFNPANNSLITISATLLILIPILVVIYGLLKGIFRFKAKDSLLGKSALALWILALISLITIKISENKDFNFKNSPTTYNEMQTKKDPFASDFNASCQLEESDNHELNPAVGLRLKSQIRNKMEFNLKEKVMNSFHFDTHP